VEYPSGPFTKTTCGARISEAIQVTQFWIRDSTLISFPVIPIRARADSRNARPRLANHHSFSHGFWLHAHADSGSPISIRTGLQKVPPSLRVRRGSDERIVAQPLIFWNERRSERAKAIVAPAIDPLWERLTNPKGKDSYVNFNLFKIFDFQ
jgi:hypothetical protein